MDNEASHLRQKLVAHSGDSLSASIKNESIELRGSSLHVISETAIDLEIEAMKERVGAQKNVTQDERKKCDKLLTAANELEKIRKTAESHSQMDEALIRSAVNLKETCQKVEKRINDLDLEIDRATGIDQQEEYLSCQVKDIQSFLCLIEEEDDDERFSRLNDSQITFLSKRIEKLESENAKIREDAEARIKELNELLLSFRDEVAAAKIARMTAVTLQSTAEQKAYDIRKTLEDMKRDNMRMSSFSETAKNLSAYVEKCQADERRQNVSQTIIEKLEKENCELKASLELLQKQLDDVREAEAIELRETQAKLTASTELNDKLTQQLETTRRRVAMLQKQLADSKSDVKPDLSKKVAELESQLKLKDEELVRQPEVAAQIATPASQFPIRSENPPADSCSGLKRSHPTQEKGPDRSRLRTNEAGEEASVSLQAPAVAFQEAAVLSPGAPAEPDPAAAVHGEERRSPNQESGFFTKFWN